MIKTIADLLKAFLDEERKKLDAEELTHGPTIGAMYEGLTKEIVERSLPQELDLRVVSGFAFCDDQTSGELDCMLVRGEGQIIPYTTKYKWHIKDIIAVFEVKKTLSAEELSDSYNHLRDLVRIYATYLESDQAKDVRVNLDLPRRIFSQITGIIAPIHSNVEELEFDIEMIYHTIVMEFLSPIRIVIGHHGWKKETTLRNHIAKLLEDRIDNPQGMGAGSFPQLIIGGIFSIVKANGCPYAPPMIDGKWPFLLSTSHNPLRIMMELIFTKLEFFYPVNLISDESIEREAMSICLKTKAVRLEEKSGWEYEYVNFSEEDLKNRGPSYNWEPAKINDSQHAIIARLCKDGTINLTDSDFIEFASNEEGGIDCFIKSLIDTQLVARNENELVLTTINCQTVFYGSHYYAGENSSGQICAWLEHKTGKNISDLKISSI